MKDQHTKISGYRDLSQEEIDLMNEAKQLEAQVLAFAEKLDNKLRDQIMDGGSESERVTKSDAGMWAQMGRRTVQVGFMELVRAIAQPQPTKIK